MTITGTILSASGTARISTLVRFIPESNPQADTGGVLTAIPVDTTTNGSGAFSVTLEQGIYTVQVGTLRRDVFRIEVPDGGGPYDIKNLIILTAIPPQSAYVRISGGYLQLKNTETGLWHTLRVVGAAGFEQLEISAGS